MFSKLNEAYDSVKNGLEAQIVIATAEQKNLLADAKLSLADLKLLIADLKEENRHLKEAAQLKIQMQPDRGHGWLIMVDDPDPSRRYCQVCYYHEGKTMPLSSAKNAKWCPKCSAYRT